MVALSMSQQVEISMLSLKVSLILELYTQLGFC